MAKKKSIRSGLLVTLAAFTVLVLLGCYMIGGINKLSGEEERALVEQAVRTAALTCYAVEGAYPANIEYLKENYGLYYDEAVYIVRYSAFASNIFPDIYVMEGGSGLQ